MSDLLIERSFVRLDEGQVHLRRLAAHAEAQAGAVPLLLLHASPASSWFMQGLMLALRAVGHEADIIAPDTLGNGDSAAPAPEHPDIAYFADGLARLLDGLGVERIDLYGTHTGARIACEFAAAYPDRVRRLILDGITEYDAATRELVVANYAPRVEPDEYGRHLIWAFNFCRDQALYFPHFDKRPETRLAGNMPPPDVLHRITLDVLKALGTYSKPYIAAFEYQAFARMPAIAAPTLLLRRADELAVLNQSIARALELLPQGHEAVIGAGDAAKAAAITQFLAGDEA